MNNYVLEARSISKSYILGSACIEVLSKLSVRFEEGLFFTIQGASGSGKTTLLQLLGGLEKPDKGYILYRGENILQLSAKELAKWRAETIGFVFQSYHLLPELSALENIELPALIIGKGNQKKAMELLEAVGLEKRANHRPNELSGGEQQRVAIARALRNDPPVILADEPTGNLDGETGKQIIHLLLSIQKEKNKTLILVTHEREIATLGDKQLLLSHGKITEIESKFST
ncbi:ABC transporter [Methylacidiphilum kamchatkense Kam1]|uniref:ABC transporter n=1 Tax=Methylacidiphilum kamchatkense Kam1 TaxID=1202785 RepID=A0A0C1URQ2_9BACT|nr:ABC transporter ATP-binding protein [Methylacidiphilum kamchatkense]KIE58964.1 ABC transporter [Methylacidiphilum kamchatkense Kam1]QDQ43154.1 putative ABC transport system ATP-binding protein/lipoprotein-releasing system ATP-binding protein [Methylacidiphilum kamchatkense Kam1]